MILETLAAAYAEAGRFPEALQAARKALDFAVEQKNPVMVEAIRAQMRLYGAGIPLRLKPQQPARSSLSSPGMVW